LLRPLDEPGTQGIRLDVSQNGQQMFVALHREALEPAREESPAHFDLPLLFPPKQIRVMSLNDRLSTVSITNARWIARFQEFS
jgi:hypothetical protein